MKSSTKSSHQKEQLTTIVVLGKQTSSNVPKFKNNEKIISKISFSNSMILTSTKASKIVTMEVLRQADSNEMGEHDALIKIPSGMHKYNEASE